MADRARVSWAGVSELKNPTYSMHLCTAYLRYLNIIFKGNSKHIIAAFLWDPKELARALKSKKTFPDDIQQGVNEVLTIRNSWAQQYKVQR